MLGTALADVSDRQITMKTPCQVATQWSASPTRTMAAASPTRTDDVTARGAREEALPRAEPSSPNPRASTQALPRLRGLFRYSIRACAPLDGGRSRWGPQRSFRTDARAATVTPTRVPPRRRRRSPRRLQAPRRLRARRRVHCPLRRRHPPSRRRQPPVRSWRTASRASSPASWTAPTSRSCAPCAAPTWPDSSPSRGGRGDRRTHLGRVPPRCWGGPPQIARDVNADVDRVFDPAGLVTS